MDRVVGRCSRPHTSEEAFKSSGGVALASARDEKALRQVRSICGGLPETTEVEAWGHPTFRAGKKMFAALGEGEEGLSIGLKVGHDRQEELLRDGRFFPTPYA